MSNKFGGEKNLNLDYINIDLSRTKTMAKYLTVPHTYI